MEPRPYTPILRWNKSIWIELYGPQIFQTMNSLSLDLHNMFELIFWKFQAIFGNKLEIMAERKCSIRGIIRIKLYYRCYHDPRCGYIFQKVDSLRQFFLLCEGVSIHPKTLDWRLKLVKDKFQSGDIVYIVHFIAISNQTYHINIWGGPL